MQTEYGLLGTNYERLNIKWKGNRYTLDFLYYIKILCFHVIIKKLKISYQTVYRLMNI